MLSLLKKSLVDAKEQETGELSGGKKLSQVFRSSAMLKGVDPSKLVGELGTMSLPKEAQDSLGGWAVYGLEYGRAGQGNAGT